MNAFVNIDGGHYKNVSFFFQIFLFFNNGCVKVKFLFIGSEINRLINTASIKLCGGNNEDSGIHCGGRKRRYHHD